MLGQNLYIPVRRRSYDLGGYSYINFSKVFKSKTRLTCGSYHYTSDVVVPDAQRAGGQFGFEQSFTEKFSFQADWITGRHANGYFTPGLVYKPNPKLTGYIGYSMGNSNITKGNHFFYLEVGFSFN